MSWLDDIFSGSSNEDVGNQVLQAYYDEASMFPEFTFQSYEEWVNYLTSKVSDLIVLIGELVKMNSAATSIEGAMDRVRLLANQSEGQATIPQITQTAGGRGDTINWSEALPEITINTVEDVAELASEVAQDVGSGVVGSFKMMKYLPFILLGGGAIYIAFVASKHGSLFKR